MDYFKAQRNLKIHTKLINLSLQILVTIQSSVELVNSIFVKLFELSRLY
jgi:hypothetical protein